MEEKNEVKTVCSNIQLAVAGSVDAGKSSLIGVLVYKELDNGRGSARSKITKLKHELESGRTSQVSCNYIKENDKVITMVDLCGHERYLKTTLFGLTGLFVDYGVIVVGANMGISKMPMTKEHLAILLHLKIPFLVAVTKTDIAPSKILEETKEDIRSLLKKVDKLPVMLEGNSDTDNKYIDLMATSERVVPIICISNKTGYNIDFLRNFLVSLKSRVKPCKNGDKSVFYINSTFDVPGVGLVLSGMLKGETIINGQTMLLGPYDGEFVSFKVKSMHNSIQESVNSLVHGESGCLACRFLNKKEIKTKESVRKGMIVLQDKKQCEEFVTSEFTATIKILEHPSTIASTYQCVIHCGSARQSAQILLSKDQLLRAGEKAVVGFKFIYHPEYLEVGTNFFGRESGTKIIGKIISLKYDELLVKQFYSQQPSEKKEK